MVSVFFNVILILITKWNSFHFFLFSSAGPRMVCLLIFLEVGVSLNCNNIIRERIKFKMKKDSCQVGTNFIDNLNHGLEMPTAMTLLNFHNLVFNFCKCSPSQLKPHSVHCVFQDPSGFYFSWIACIIQQRSISI